MITGNISRRFKAILGNVQGNHPLLYSNRRHAYHQQERQGRHHRASWTPRCSHYDNIMHHNETRHAGKALRFSYIKSKVREQETTVIMEPVK